MSRVIVAVSKPADVRELIRAGHALAALWGGETVAVHASRSSSAEMAAHLQRQDATLQIHPGEPLSVISRLARSGDVAAVVLGSGGHADHPGASRFTRSLVTALPTPVLVVPPGRPPAAGLRRVLVPLEAGVESSPSLERWVAAMGAQEIQVRPLHIHAPGAVPAFADHEPHAKQVWGDEFLLRELPSGALDGELLRDVGMPADEIIERCRPEVADLVILSWNRTLGDGHAPIVAEALSRSRIPVLLLPADHR